MAAALPVVASRVGGLDRVVREQKTGLLYPPGDAAGLQAALAGLRADPALCRRLGASRQRRGDRKSTRLNSSHMRISYAVFCLKKKNFSTHQTYPKVLTSASWKR